MGSIVFVNVFLKVQNVLLFVEILKLKFSITKINEGNQLS